jgi:GTP cyclohydrolase I
MKTTIASCVHEILIALNENPAREGLEKTPQRVEKAFLELTSGMGIKPKDIIGDAIFSTESSGMILQKNIEFYSLCEHHMLPFFGVVHLAYMPNKKIIGLSKVSRIIDVLSKRLQVQENLTHEIAQNLKEILNPKGIAVYVEAQHFCMMMRGIKKQNSTSITTDFSGLFDENNLKNEFFACINK